MLLDLIPISLYLLLKKEGAASFVRVLCSERIDVSTLWTKSMREKLSHALRAHLSLVLHEEEEGSDSFAKIQKIVYEEHDDSDWLGCEDFGYYLSHLESSSSMVSPTDIVQFRQLILQRLADDSTDLSNQAILLSLLANIMEQSHSLPHVNVEASDESEAVKHNNASSTLRFVEFEILAGLLKKGTSQPDEGSEGAAGEERLWEGRGSLSRERVMVQMNAMRVCRWMVNSSPDGDVSVSECLQLGIADFVESVLKQCVSCLFLPRQSEAGGTAQPDGVEAAGSGRAGGGEAAGAAATNLSGSDCVIQLTLAAIRFASDISRYPAGLTRWEREQRIVPLLLLCVQSDRADVIQAAIECMGHVCSSQSLHAALIRGHFHLLLLRQLLRDVFAMTEGAGEVADSIASIRTRCLSTCQALYSFAYGQHNTQEIQEELTCLLTAPMLERLDSAAEFLGIFAAEHRTPDLVWGSCNRQELRTLIKQTFKHLNVTSPQLNEQPPSWTFSAGSPSSSEQAAGMSIELSKFSYSNICNLTRVGGIYVEIFNEQVLQAELAAGRFCCPPGETVRRHCARGSWKVEGKETTDEQKVEAMRAALNIAKRLPSSSVLRFARLARATSRALTWLFSALQLASFSLPTSSLLRRNSWCLEREQRQEASGVEAYTTSGSCLCSCSNFSPSVPETLVRSKSSQSRLYSRGAVNDDR
eukprot:768551-Hanusia_phi.AAC.9